MYLDVTCRLLLLNASNKKVSETTISIHVHHCHANILPNTGHENNTAQPKADKCPSSTSHFSPFSCCLSVVL